VDGPTDVIIVGAGVAGSALAYTLGKVALLLPFSFLPVLPFRSAG
jgi:flavin-dependent dehydrogenase